MSYKSFGEIYLSKFLDGKKKEEKRKEDSTKELIKKREEALRLFKQTKNEVYAEKIRFYDRILDHSEAKSKGKIGMDAKPAA